MACSQALAIMIKLSGAFTCKCLCGHILSFLLDKCIGGKWLSCDKCVCLGKCQKVFEGLVPLGVSASGV